jgi:hypothetical protein
MKQYLFIAMCVAASLLTAPTLGVAQLQQKEMLQYLGPEPLWGPPSSLANLVEITQAAIVADIIAPGELRLERASTPQASPLGQYGYVTYSVAIRDVLYNKVGSAAPALGLGDRVQLTQLVGRQEAEAFTSGRIPVAPRDQCLLFLWHRPGAAEWSILQWPLQFRKSPTAGAAESLGRPAELGWLDAQWLGPRVPITNVDTAAVAPTWSAFLTEVRRLSAPVKAQ